MVGNQAVQDLNNEISLLDKQDISSVYSSLEKYTLDQLLHEWVKRTPDARLFADAPNRTDFALGDPLNLSFADVYRISGEIAEQFKAHGLNPGDVLAVQLPNTVELPVIILAALRAGLIPTLLPILWRNHEIDMAFQLVPARALITIGEFSGYSHSQMMCDLAFDHLNVRFVYGLGPSQADGVTSLNEFFGDPNPPVFENEPSGKPFTPHSNQPALITWTTRPGIGVRPIYRTHRELIASGLIHVLQLGLQATDHMVNPYPLTGLIGLSGMFMPSLLVGASMTQHHPFNYDVFLNQIQNEKANYTAAPAAVLKAFMENNVFNSQAQTLSRFGCVWNAPHDYTNQYIKSVPDIPIFDIRNLHETTIYISQRQSPDQQGHIQLGDLTSTDSSISKSPLLETRFRGRMSSRNGDDAKYHGVLYVRGASVPLGSGLPAKSRPSQESQEGWTNTGLSCSIAKSSQDMNRVICENDPDIIYHGNLMMFADDLDKLYSGFDGFLEAAVIPQSDDIMGSTLAVAGVPLDENTPPMLDDLIAYLKYLGVAPYKYPEKLTILDRLPRDHEGQILRTDIKP